MKNSYGLKGKESTINYTKTLMTQQRKDCCDFVNITGVTNAY